MPGAGPGIKALPGFPARNGPKKRAKVIIVNKQVSNQFHEKKEIDLKLVYSLFIAAISNIADSYVYDDDSINENVVSTHNFVEVEDNHISDNTNLYQDRSKFELMRH